MMTQQHLLCRRSVTGVLLLFAWLSLVVVAQAKKKTWKVYHRMITSGIIADDANSMNPPKFHDEWKQRGTILLSNEENEEATTTTDGDGGNAVGDTDGSSSSSKIIHLQIHNQNDDIESWTRELTQRVVSEESTTTNRYWYQIRIVPEEEEEEDKDNLRNSSWTTTNILATVPACDLRRANFRDEFVFNFQQGTGHVLSMSYIPLISPLAPKTCREYKTSSSSSSTDDDKKYTLDSRIRWETSIPAMVVGKPPARDAPKIKSPPGLKWLPGLNKKDSPFLDDDKQKQQQQQQPEPGLMGFLRRYWYILVPLMVINLMSSEQQPAAADATATPAGAATGTAAATTTTTAAVATATSPRAASTGTSPRQRRSKKD
jgi:hypothetical protein